MPRVMIIAEVGVNHNGDLALAKQLVEAAAAAGADVAKFQTFHAGSVVVRNAMKAAYQEAALGDGESQFEMLQRLELSADAHKELMRHCAACGIGFLSTGFDIQDIDFLVALGQDRFKIPSGELTNLPYLRHIGSFGKPVILSTGMATLGEVEAALDVLDVAGTPRQRITVLHCTTEYPAPFADVNLRAMATLAAAFGVEVGYSDHTPGIEAAIAAVALGATVVEKHITLSRDLPGPDQRASIEPQELAALVAAVRNIEIALGDGVKRVTLSEAGNRPIARKSLVARRTIQQGEEFTPENVTAKRPGTGLSPMRWDEVIGRCAPRDFAEDEMIELAK